MILTIKGADFSGSGLGTNTSVSITLTKGNGVSGNKVSSLTLEKNQVVSTATVIATGLSLQTGYENLVVTVTMTGTGDVSSWFSNGTVTIPSGTTITGNIKITASATAISGGEVEPEQPGTGGGINENIPIDFYDYSNGNDWYVMYSKNDENNGVPIRYGLNTSNSTKAKNYVCSLENGATYQITFKNNTPSTGRCRIVTFAEEFNAIDKSALSTDANTANVTTTNVIYYDRDNSVLEYSTTFTNTLNHKTLVMTLGWATAAKGTVDIDVNVTKIANGTIDEGDTDEGDNGEITINGTFVEGDGLQNDWYVYKPDTTDVAYIRTSNSAKAKNIIYNVEDGAKYKFEFTNNSGSTTGRCRIALFDTDFSNIEKMPLSTDGNSDLSQCTPSVYVVAYGNETSFTGEFENTYGAKILIATIGWAAAAGGDVDLTYKLTKINN